MYRFLLQNYFILYIFTLCLCVHPLKFKIKTKVKTRNIIFLGNKTKTVEKRYGMVYYNKKGIFINYLFGFLRVFVCVMLRRHRHYMCVHLCEWVVLEKYFMLICVSTLPWLLILFSCVLETEAGDRRLCLPPM